MEGILKDGWLNKRGEDLDVGFYKRMKPSIFQQIICNFHNLYNLWNNYNKKKDRI